MANMMLMMTKNVSLQITSMFSPIITLVTWIRSLASVYPHVPNKFRWKRKLSAAVLTGVPTMVARLISGLMTVIRSGGHEKLKLQRGISR